MKFVPFVLFLAIVGVSLSIGNAQTTASPKKSTGKSTANKSAPGKTVSGKAAPTSGKTAPTKTGAKTSPAGSHTATKKKTVRGTAVAGPPRQSAPTPERYREIQQALASKGYLKSEPNGVWDAQSMEAMRQYQTDRKLEPTGKLTAAALIDLGLGPKNETHPSATAAEVPEPPKIETAPRP
jgi:hypothetical protein